MSISRTFSSGTTRRGGALWSFRSTRSSAPTRRLRANCGFMLPFLPDRLLQPACRPPESLPACAGLLRGFPLGLLSRLTARYLSRTFRTFKFSRNRTEQGIYSTPRAKRETENPELPIVVFSAHRLPATIPCGVPTFPFSQVSTKTDREVYFLGHSLPIVVGKARAKNPHNPLWPPCGISAADPQGMV